MDTLNSSTSVDAAFDELKRRLDHLASNPSHDNEATRHDRLIVPFLTHPLTLGWDYNDLVAQASITIPSQLLDSHIFRESEPKTRKPDILVTSSAFQFNALVVEEKGGQKNIDDLNGYRFQLHEYQALYECVWGLLTDGDRWILKKGLESFHTFDSLDELRARLSDIQHCIGKKNLLHRKLAYGTCDLVIVVPSRGFLTFAGTACDMSADLTVLGKRDFLDLGNAQSTIVRTGPHGAIVVDAGTHATQVDHILAERNIRQLDLLIVTKADRDHERGLHRLLDQFRGRIQKVYFPCDVMHMRGSSTLALLADIHRRDNLSVYRLENPDDNPRVLYRDAETGFEICLVAPSMVENLHARLSPYRTHSDAVVTLHSGGQHFVLSRGCSPRSVDELKTKLNATDRDIVDLPTRDVRAAASIIGRSNRGTEVIRLNTDNSVVDAYTVNEDGRIVPQEVAHKDASRSSGSSGDTIHNY